MKFSLFMRRRAAAAINPTVAGRNPTNAASTYLLCLNFEKAMDIDNTKKNEGKQTAAVVKQDHKILTVGE